MIEIKNISELSVLNELKREYFSSTTAPIDGMWHFGFVPMSAHYGFYENEELVGFCCINSDGYLLQYFLSQAALTQTDVLFAQLIDRENEGAVIGEVKGAFVSTAETQFLSLSLDHAGSTNVNSLMYQVRKGTRSVPLPDIDLQLATSEHLSELVDFAVETLGAPKEWLSGYFGNLVARKELWAYWVQGEVVATGECRLNDEFQTNTADLGMIVAKNQRGKGVATRILQKLASYAQRKGLLAICSTESANIGAQKSISKAGFIAQNRIVQVNFK
ncbi:GNAT family N-acetyltransferase [Vibrio makurazakiensis]|uniref:GNAT family N-acetyltransferase n=1 Tax=Vibrio makurazakiensis TaxID=2910250 RepID=UPI003D133474